MILQFRSVRQEIENLNKYIVQFEDEVRRFRLRKILKIVEEILNEPLKRAIS